MVLSKWRYELLHDEVREVKILEDYADDGLSVEGLQDVAQGLHTSLAFLTHKDTETLIENQPLDCVSLSTKGQSVRQILCLIVFLAKLHDTLVM